MEADLSSDNMPLVVIFDFDGTIADTMSFLTDLAGSLLSSRYGMDLERARRAYVETTGLPFSKQMEIIFPGDPRNGPTVETFERAKRDSLMDFKIFPDAPPAIETIREHGMKACVSSGNYKELIVRLLEERGIGVDLVMGYRPGFEKGADHFRHAADIFGVPLEQLVFVGDSHRDGLAAREMNVRFIARTGLLSKEDIERLLPGAPVVSSLGQVLPILGIEIARDDRGVRATSRATRNSAKDQRPSG
jgi:phosphoglycolate phosphatase-like HAD superfamily hydrolase